MRRRIYIDPESGLRDATTDPHHFADEEPWTAPPSWCRTGVLYDDALWALYREACERADELHMQIIAKLRYESLDEVETRAARRMEEMLDPAGDAYDFEECEALKRDLVENAQRARENRPQGEET